MRGKATAIKGLSTRPGKTHRPPNKSATKTAKAIMGPKPKLPKRKAGPAKSGTSGKYTRPGSFDYD